MSDVGTEAGHGTIEGIAGGGVAGRVDGGELAQGRLPSAKCGGGGGVIPHDVCEFVV